MKNTPIVAWVIIGACLVGAVAFALFASTKISPRLTWNNTTIPCLKTTQTPFAVHLTAKISILTSGVVESIPSRVGIAGNCIAEIHAADAGGTIEVASNDATRTYTVSDFFAVWGQSLERPGFTLAATVNGSSTPSIATHVFKDSDSISLVYTKN